MIKGSKNVSHEANELFVSGATIFLTKNDTHYISLYEKN